jgi:hypothetical protein
MSAHGVANTLWALATLGWQAEEGMMHSILEMAAVRVAVSMNARDVGNALWALATLGWQGTKAKQSTRGVLEGAAGEGAMRFALVGAAVLAAPSMRPQDVTNTLWALATLGWRLWAGPSRERLEAAAVRVAPTMNAQEADKTLSALATLGWQAGERSMRSALKAAAVCVALTMSAQNAANSLFGCQQGEGHVHHIGGVLFCAECGGNSDLEFLLVCKPLARGDGLVTQHENCLPAMHSYCMRPPRMAPTDAEWHAWRCVHCEEHERAENAAVLEPVSFEAEAPDWYTPVRGGQRIPDHLFLLRPHLCVRLGVLAALAEAKLRAGRCARSHSK